MYVAWAPFFSGAERAFLLLAKALDRRRYEPFVILGTDGELRSHLEALDIPHKRIAIHRTNWRRPIPWAISTSRIAVVARSIGACLIHSNEAPSFHATGYAAKLLHIPSVAHVRFPDGDFRWFLKPGFARAVFVSNYLLAEASKEYPDVFQGRAEVIHDGVVLPNQPMAEERVAGREALGIRSEKPAVLLAGQVAEIKGIWEFIEAAQLLVRAGVPATFVVLGDDLRGGGEMRRKAEERVRALGLDEHFRFLGFRRNAAELVPLFDIAAVPSHVEPLGNATLEAMAAGLPVVGSRVGGIPEMVVDGETGLLVPPRDGSALAAALRRLLVDPMLRARFGVAGRERAATAFSVGLHADRVQGLYDQLLARVGVAHKAT